MSDIIYYYLCTLFTIWGLGFIVLAYFHFNLFFHIGKYYPRKLISVIFCSRGLSSLQEEFGRDDQRLNFIIQTEEKLLKILIWSFLFIMISAVFLWLCLALVLNFK